MSTDTSPPRGDTPSGRTLTKFAEDAHLLVSLSAGGELRPRLGLGGRLFLGAVILLAVTLGLAIAFSTRQARRVAEETILADLKTVPTMYEGYRDSQASARRRQVRSLAEEPGTKALLGEVVGHAETFRDTAADFAKSLGAGTVFFFDPRGVLIARSDREAGEEAGRDFSQVAWVRDPVSKLQDATAFILELRGTKRLSLVAAASVVQGEGEEMRLNGVLAAAFPVDRERAGELARITSGEVAFLANVAAREQPPRIEIVASTSRLADPLLPSRLAGQAGVVSTLFERGEPFGPLEFTTGGDVYIGTAVPIKSGAGEPIAALLVARSKSAELAAFERIRAGLLVVGGALLLSSLPISFVLAQGLTRPLRQLSQAAEEIGRGHLEVPVPAAGPGEVGVLARAFSGMVSELQAKAQLEALVADLQRRPGDITLRGRGLHRDPADSGLEPGVLFAERYEVLSILGEGGMGHVYRVRDRVLEDEVALKILKTDGSSKGAPERLRQEIKLARMITHPNVVRVHDFGEANGTRFLTMEYVPGTTLREVLQQRQRLELIPALQIAKQICRGLAAVHKAGIVHGDLKPQNVMVMGNGVAKLMDFGVARARGHVSEVGGPTAGTPLYMSPEQARGGELDERSDIYSSGVVMFELFTGSCPFFENDIYEIMRLHMEEPPPDPRILRKDVPDMLAQIILSCLAKSRLQRPASASDLDRLLMRVHL